MKLLGGAFVGLLTWQKRALAAGYYNLGAMWKGSSSSGSSSTYQEGVADSGVSGGWYGWGTDNFGNVGGNATLYRSVTTTAVDTSSPNSNWNVISSGCRNSYAINTSGQLWAVGNNGSGQLGNNSTVNVSNPVQENGASTLWTSVSNGLNTVAGVSGGKLYTWGGSNNGCLANNTTTPAISKPAVADATTTWTVVNLGYDWGMGIKGGALFAWGNNASGQLGNNSTLSKSNPTAVAGVGANTPWDVIAAGNYHGCGILSGKLYCWGGNVSGELGDNTTVNKSTPTQVGAATNWVSVSCGGGGASAGHTLAINALGELYAWGAALSGQLGNNTTTPALSNPAKIGAVTLWKMVAAGAGYSMATRTDGSMYAWGFDGSGQLGNNATAPQSNPVRENSNSTLWKAVSCGGISSSTGIK